MDLKKSSVGAGKMYLIAIIAVFLLIAAVCCFNHSYNTHESLFTIVGFVVLAVDVLVSYTLYKKWYVKWEEDHKENKK